MNHDELLPKLIRACLDNDRRMVEEISSMMIKTLKKSKPEIAKEMSQALTYSRNGASALRSADVQPLPIDRESRSSLGKAEEPLEVEPPILSEQTINELIDFLSEREKIEQLIMEDITPPNSMLFVGPPGVGKTYSAKWISYKLNLPLVTMDLATSISSYLGRSGQNIKSLFDYARSFPSILFLDELDAIAKRRDDASDLGELKRLVNVLLKEMETWPSQSIIIAATNHPDLLDKAIWRRFDRVIPFDLPEPDQRKELILRCFGKFEKNFSKMSIDFMVKQTEGVNASDICKICMHIKRKVVMKDSLPDLIAIEETCTGNYKDRQSKIEVCKMLKNSFPELSGRDISRITKISITSVSRYLQTGGANK
ncbi:MAG: AAA family ATPase [Candidatus Pelethousia sp.]|nr:AAA family ATPase [Candidatus Pelethousia sp.]